MQGSSNGPLATFMMLVPLVAVPLLAIFGVPQFSPLAASPSQPGDDFDHDRDSGLGEGARFAEDDAHSSAPRSGRLNARNTNSGGGVRDGSSSKEGTRRFIPRDGQPENDPFIELDRAADRRNRGIRSKGNRSTDDDQGDQYAERDRPDARALREEAPRELPGWELETNPPKSEPDDSRAEQAARTDRERPEEPLDKRDSADRPHEEVAVRANNADNPPGHTPGHHDAAADDTSRFLDNAPVADDQYNHSRSQRDAHTDNRDADNPFAEEPRPAGTHDELVATLGGSAEKNAPANSASRGKRSVEVATERIERRGPLTWKGAVQRLNGLGVRQYELQPGQTDGEFHFSCSYVHPDTPRVSRRFEAEAGEPLRAVEKVLAQIETWMEENEKR